MSTWFASKRVLFAALAALAAGPSVTCIAADSDAFTKVLAIPEIAAIGNAITVHLRTSPSCEEEPEADDGNPGESAIDALLSRSFGSNNSWPPYRPVEVSGTIISTSGEVVTTAILSNGDQCRDYVATFVDGSTTHARLVAHDPASSAGLLQLERAGFPAVRIGDPVRLRPGETVVSVSSPQELHGTIGVGVISNPRRVMREPPGGDNYRSYYVQHSALIHMGSSGGPLLNEHGELVGIHQAIFTTSGRFEGIAFALPVDFVMHAVTDLRTLGRVRYAYLGVTMQESLLEDGATRVTLSTVEKDSPAEGKLQVGDAVLSVSGLTINNSAEFAAAVQSYRPDDVVTLRIERGGEILNMDIKLAEAPAVDDPPPFLGKPMLYNRSTP